MHKELLKRDSRPTALQRLLEKTTAFQKGNEHRYPDWYRAAVVAAYREGLPIAEIARATGASVITIRSWVSSATQSESKPSFGFRELKVVRAPKLQQPETMPSDSQHSRLAAKVMIGEFAMEFGIDTKPQFLASVLLHLQENSHDSR